VHSKADKMASLV